MKNSFNGKEIVRIMFKNEGKGALIPALVKTNVRVSCLNEAIAIAIELSETFHKGDIIVNAKINGVSERICYSSNWPLETLLEDYEGRINLERISIFQRCYNIKNKALEVSNYYKGDLEETINHLLRTKRDFPLCTVITKYCDTYLEVEEDDTFRSVYEYFEYTKLLQKYLNLPEQITNIYSFEDYVNLFIQNISV